jgi:hypothetical protein
MVLLLSDLLVRLQDLASSQPTRAARHSPRTTRLKNNPP